MNEPGQKPDLIPPEVQRRVGPKGIDQRQQQIDPAGKHRVDPDARPDSNTKQPGLLGPDSKPLASFGD